MSTEELAEWLGIARKHDADDSKGVASWYE